MGVLALWLAKRMTAKERRALRWAQFDPDAFDLDPTDRTTIVGCVIVLVLFIGALWMLRP